MVTPMSSSASPCEVQARAYVIYPEQEALGYRRAGKQPVH